MFPSGGDDRVDVGVGALSEVASKLIVTLTLNINKKIPQKGKEAREG